MAPFPPSTLILTISGLIMLIVPVKIAKLGITPFSCFFCETDKYAFCTFRNFSKLPNFSKVLRRITLTAPYRDQLRLKQPTKQCLGYRYFKATRNRFLLRFGFNSLKVKNRIRNKVT